MQIGFPSSMYKLCKQTFKMCGNCRFKMFIVDPHDLYLTVVGTRTSHVQLCTTFSFSVESLQRQFLSLLSL